MCSSQTRPRHWRITPHALPPRGRGCGGAAPRSLSCFAEIPCDGATSFHFHTASGFRRPLLRVHPSQFVSPVRILLTNDCWPGNRAGICRRRSTALAPATALALAAAPLSLQHHATLSLALIVPPRVQAIVSDTHVPLWRRPCATKLTPAAAKLRYGLAAPVYIPPAPNSHPVPRNHQRLKLVFSAVCRIQWFR